MKIKRTYIEMTTTFFVDSRLRAGGTDSAFEVDLRESVHLSNSRLRVDKINFTDSFLTTDAGSNLYFSDGAGSIASVSIPEGAYTGTSLASALQAATGRATIPPFLLASMIPITIEISPIPFNSQNHNSRTSFVRRRRVPKLI